MQIQRIILATSETPLLYLYKLPGTITRMEIEVKQLLGIPHARSHIFAETEILEI